MKNLSFPEFIWRTGVERDEIFWLLLSAIGGLFFALFRWRKNTGSPAAGTRESRALNYLLQRLSAAALVVLGLYCVYSDWHKRYLLRPGVGRYINGYVYAYGKTKHNTHYWYRYEVASQTYEGHAPCVGRDRCPPHGARYYIRYSLPEPQLSQSTGVPVPDTLQTVPALGWDSLP